MFDTQVCKDMSKEVSAFCGIHMDDHVSVNKLVASNIREFRTWFRWTQRELAEYVNVSRNTVGLWETGRRLPTVDVFVKLGRVLHVDINQLVFRKMQNKEDAIRAHYAKILDGLHALHQLLENHAHLSDLIEVIEKLVFAQMKILEQSDTLQRLERMDKADPIKENEEKKHE